MPKSSSECKNGEESSSVVQDPVTSSSSDEQQEQLNDSKSKKNGTEEYEEPDCPDGGASSEIDNTEPADKPDTKDGTDTEAGADSSADSEEKAIKDDDVVAYLKGLKEDQEKTGDAEIPSVHSANAWEQADLGDDNRKAKFLKLMGAAKEAVGASLTSTVDQHSVTACRPRLAVTDRHCPSTVEVNMMTDLFVKKAKTDLFKDAINISIKSHTGPFVIGDGKSRIKRSADDDKKLVGGLEEQYNQSMQDHLKHRDKRHRGLGFHAESSASVADQQEPILAADEVPSDPFVKPKE